MRTIGKVKNANVYSFNMENNGDDEYVEVDGDDEDDQQLALAMQQSLLHRYVAGAGEAGEGSGVDDGIVPTAKENTAEQTISIPQSQPLEIMRVCVQEPIADVDCDDDKVWVEWDNTLRPIRSKTREKVSAFIQFVASLDPYLHSESTWKTLRIWKNKFLANEAETTTYLGGLQSNCVVNPDPAALGVCILLMSMLSVQQLLVDNFPWFRETPDQHLLLQIKGKLKVKELGDLEMYAKFFDQRHSWPVLPFLLDPVNGASVIDEAVDFIIEHQCRRLENYSTIVNKFQTQLKSFIAPPHFSDAEQNTFAKEANSQYPISTDGNFGRGLLCHFNFDRMYLYIKDSEYNNKSCVFGLNRYTTIPAVLPGFETLQQFFISIPRSLRNMFIVRRMNGEYDFTQSLTMVYYDVMNNTIFTMPGDQTAITYNLWILPGLKQTIKTMCIEMLGSDESCWYRNLSEFLDFRTFFPQHYQQLQSFWDNLKQFFETESHMPMILPVRQGKIVARHISDTNLSERIQQAEKEFEGYKSLLDYYDNDFRRTSMNIPQVDRVMQTMVFSALYFYGLQRTFVGGQTWKSDKDTTFSKGNVYMSEAARKKYQALCDTRTYISKVDNLASLVGYDFSLNPVRNNYRVTWLMEDYPVHDMIPFDLAPYAHREKYTSSKIHVGIWKIKSLQRGEFYEEIEGQSYKDVFIKSNRIDALIFAYVQTSMLLNIPNVLPEYVAQFLVYQAFLGPNQYSAAFTKDLTYRQYLKKNDKMVRITDLEDCYEHEQFSEYESFIEVNNLQPSPWERLIERTEKLGEELREKLDKILPSIGKDELQMLTRFGVVMLNERAIYTLPVICESRYLLDLPEMVYRIDNVYNPEREFGYRIANPSTYRRYYFVPPIDKNRLDRLFTELYRFCSEQDMKAFSSLYRRPTTDDPAEDLDIPPIEYHAQRWMKMLYPNVIISCETTPRTATFLQVWDAKREIWKPMFFVTHHNYSTEMRGYLVDMELLRVENMINIYTDKDIEKVQLFPQSTKVEHDHRTPLVLVCLWCGEERVVLHVELIRNRLQVTRSTPMPAQPIHADCKNIIVPQQAAVPSSVVPTFVQFAICQGGVKCVQICPTSKQCTDALRPFEIKTDQGKSYRGLYTTHGPNIWYFTSAIVNGQMVEKLESVEVDTSNAFDVMNATICLSSYGRIAYICNNALYVRGVSFRHTFSGKLKMSFSTNSRVDIFPNREIGGAAAGGTGSTGKSESRLMAWDNAHQRLIYILSGIIYSSVDKIKQVLFAKPISTMYAPKIPYEEDCYGDFDEYNNFIIDESGEWGLLTDKDNTKWKLLRLPLFEVGDEVQINDMRNAARTAQMIRNPRIAEDMAKDITEAKKQVREWLSGKDEILVEEFLNSKQGNSYLLSRVENIKLLKAEDPTKRPRPEVLKRGFLFELNAYSTRKRAAAHY